MTPAPDHPQLIVVDPEHYTSRVLLTQGGMGRIVTARDRRLGRTVALKELRGDSPALAARFEREALLTARLQHPGIVSIHEAGRWPSGEPFYAMKLVPGRPLGEVIAQAGSIDRRLALLPHVLAVADAIAYAHSERIIHRDLKPGNVMVGEFGETVVIDWGLAKDLDDDAGDVDVRAGPYRTPAAAPGQTVAGEVLGTPGYMSPEQAAGRPVDPRTDVYAIGAILDHLLGGERAGLPPDLLAIVDRAMSADPAARYPSARELAEDLRRFQTGQLVAAHRYSRAQLLRRWLRRHRTAVAVAAAGVLVLTAVGALGIRRIVREQAHAASEREQAVQHRAEAEELMDFMLFDLKDRLKPIGKLELLDAVARKAKDYYEGRPETGDAGDWSNRAAALENLGEVLQLRGDGQGALAIFRTALALRQALVALDPLDPARQSRLAMAHDRIGRALIDNGDARDALASHRAALDIGERLVAAEPDNPAWQKQLATLHQSIHFARGLQADHAGAMTSLRTALAIRQRLADQDRGDPELQAALAETHTYMGDLLRVLGDSERALREFRAVLAIREALSAGDPDNAAWRQALQVARERIGQILQVQGDAAAAVAHFRALKVDDEKLLARDPTNSRWRFNIAAGHNRISESLEALGDTGPALAELRTAVAIIDELTAQDPGSVRWRRLGTDMRTRIGQLLLELGDAPGALAAIHEALPRAEQEVAEHPKHSVDRLFLARAWDQRGRALLAHGDVQGALAAGRTARSMLDKISGGNPAVPVRQAVGANHGNLGDVLLAQGDGIAALDSYRASLEVFRALAAQDPTFAQHHLDLARTHRRLGDAHDRRGDAAAARAAFGEAVSILEPLAAKHPDNLRWKRDLASYRQAAERCCRGGAR